MINTHVALLRAVNVGGTGKLPMEDLRALCRDAGFGNIRTYIASGNVVFDSDRDARSVREELEARLAAYAGRPVGVLIRSAAQLAAILRNDPFPGAPGNKVQILFLAEPASEAMIATARNRTVEELRCGDSELYIHYPDGQGRSKLAIPAAATGTGRNRNTVEKLFEMAAAKPN